MTDSIHCELDTCGKRLKPRKHPRGQRRRFCNKACANASYQKQLRGGVASKPRGRPRVRPEHIPRVYTTHCQYRNCGAELPTHHGSDYCTRSHCNMASMQRVKSRRERIVEPPIPRAPRGPRPALTPLDRTDVPQEERRERPVIGLIPPQRMNIVPLPEWDPVMRKWKRTNNNWPW